MKMKAAVIFFAAFLFGVLVTAGSCYAFRDTVAIGSVYAFEEMIRGELDRDCEELLSTEKTDKYYLGMYRNRLKGTLKLVIYDKVLFDRYKEFGSMETKDENFSVYAFYAGNNTNNLNVVFGNNARLKAESYKVMLLGEERNVKDLGDYVIDVYTYNSSVPCTMGDNERLGALYDAKGEKIQDFY